MLPVEWQIFQKSLLKITKTLKYNKNRKQPSSETFQVNTIYRVI